MSKVVSEMSLVIKIVSTYLSNQSKIEQLKEELKKMERLVRIFEMTYLDLKDKLQIQVQLKNMKRQRLPCVWL